MPALRPVTLITGASAGIGTELARVFARHGHALALVARRRDRLDALAVELSATGAPAPLLLPFDLNDPATPDRIAAALTEAGAEPQYVVNNAGFGLIGLASDLPRDEQLAMIDLNVRALTDLSLRFVESLERHRGGLMNVASIAGFVPGPGMAVYYATKAYVVSLSAALSSELGRRGVRVTALCPGPVATEFAARAGATGELAPGFLAVPAAQVAEDGYRALMAGQRRVIPGWIPRLLVGVLSLVPTSVLLAVIDRRQSRRRSASGS